MSMSLVKPTTLATVDEASAKRMKLGEYLVETQVLKPAQLYVCLKEQEITHERLGLILVRNSFVSKMTMLDAIIATKPDQIHAEQHFSIRVPPEVLIETKTMVIAERKDAVYLATLSSERQVLREISKYYPDVKIKFSKANYEKIDAYLAEVYATHYSEDSLLDKLLKRAFSEDISDIHIIPRYSTCSIFFRHNGVKVHVHECSHDEYQALAARIKDKSRMDIAERRIPQDGAFNLEYNGKMVDLRVATIPTVTNMETIVIRLLDPDRVQPSLTGLGITRVEEWRKGATRQNGLCLICGPTGSGKTTTLNATQKEMDRLAEAIYTLEDPVEFRLSYTTQVNANHNIGLDFARGIRAFMRADPDTIILGELRDAETARNAIKAAETGHLVFATLHVSDIRGSVARLRDLGVPQNELIHLLRAVLVQGLIRTTCTVCGGTGELTHSHEHGDVTEKCTNCMGTGYASRTIISECAYFPSEKEVKDMIDGHVSWPTLLDDAIIKAQSGITDYKEVHRLFREPAERRFEEMGITNYKD